MFGRLAPQLADDGWQPIPVRPGQKKPAVWRWQERRPPSVLQRWVERCADHGIGLVCGKVGRIVAIDIDVLDPDAAARLHSLAVAQFGSTPLVRVGRWPKVALLYRLTSPMPTERRTLSVGRVELLAEGAFIVGYGVHPDTGRPYSWPGESSPEFTPPSALPEVTPLQLERFADEALRLFPFVQIPEPTIGHSRGSKSRRAGGSPIVRCPRSGVVIDGRDLHLFQCVSAALSRLEHPNERELADAGWHDFVATTDLARPARDGRRAWAMRDALAKAVTVLKRAKSSAVQRIQRSRGRMAVPAGVDLTAAELEAVRIHLLSLYQRGRLRRAAWLVGDLMLRRLRNGQCVDSVGFLAKEAGEQPRTVERARRKLLELGLFDTGRQRGNRDTTAPYFPTPEFIAKSLAGQVLSVGGVSDVSPNIQGGGRPVPALALVYAASPLTEPAPLPTLIPPQAPDAVQLTMMEPAVSQAELHEALVSWTDGPMPQIVRLAYAERKRSLSLRECDIARQVRISREHVANARFETFGLSPAAVERVKHWLMPNEFPLPPGSDVPDDRSVRPHHRRGGKKPPDPGPVFPSLRLFAVIAGGEPEAVAQGQHRDRSAA